MDQPFEKYNHTYFSVINMFEISCLSKSFFIISKLKVTGHSLSVDLVLSGCVSALTTEMILNLLSASHESQVSERKSSSPRSLEFA